MIARRSFLKPLLATTLSLLSGSVLLSAPAPVAAQPQVSCVPQEVLVGVTPGFERLARLNIEATLGHVIERLPSLGVYRVKLRAGLGVDRAVLEASRVAGLAYIEPNYLYSAFEDPNDPDYAKLQWAPQKVQADLAWPLWKSRTPTVIAVLDTGIDLNHPDLENKLFRDSAGTVIGYDFINGEIYPKDDHGHGTHCAGIAAAQINNKIGMAGIAGWNADLSGSDSNDTKIMPIKVLDAKGSGSVLAIAKGITFAVENGAKVISMSLGSTETSTTLTEAINYAWSKGCVLVAAAGNSGVSAKAYPAASPNVISVAATDSTDTLASFSNYGSWVLCAAPGVKIYSTYPGGYNTLSGTSMAAPLVAGEVALLASHAPDLSNAALKAFVLKNVDPYKRYGNRTIKGGRVNVYKAIFAINSVPVAPSGLVATAKSRSQITLTWTDNSTNEANFVLERSLDKVTFTAVATLAANATSYTNSSLTANKLYYYRIRTVNAYGSSDYSNTASATTLK